MFVPFTGHYFVGYAVIGLLFAIVPIVGIVDAVGKPEWAWAKAGENRNLWIALQAIGAAIGLFGVVAAAIYYVNIRPKVIAAIEGGEPAPTVTAAATAPASWLPDPRGRHEFRYWDGTKWTDHVSDNGVPSTDPV